MRKNKTASTDMHSMFFQGVQIGFTKVATVATSISRISTFLILRSFIGHNLKFWEHRHQDSQVRSSSDIKRHAGSYAQTCTKYVRDVM